MALTPGTRIGPYEIKTPLGEGGMGVVFRALDTKLQREVALKLLPDHFADDPERLARFQREAQILASLNHPNIAQIHGLEESGNTRCIVMELVGGETLEERLKRGAIPISEALRIATQIAGALEAAHERGVVHRDLKPANVKILPNGAVKVLDFGLAKTSEGRSAHSKLSNSPTLGSMATNAGVILGTAAYMSPEQARGETVDHRSDIFSFGCVLYEMLAGRQAFEGATVSDLLASVLAREPDVSRLPVNLPPKLRVLLLRCLAKETKQRWQAIGDVRFELEHVGEATEPAAVAAPSRQGMQLAWIVAGVLALVAGASSIAAIRHLREPSAAAPELRLEIGTPTTAAPLEFALSPDGRYIVFVASGGGPQRLWLRALDKTDAQPMAGTEGADYPFWSPDSRSIGFYASGKLKRIDIAGGSPQTLANALANFGGTWSSDGTIVFSAITGPLSRISAGGGETAAVTRLGPQQVQHRFPHFLPDGQHFLYYAVGTPESTGIYLASLQNEEAKRLAAVDGAAVYLPPDMIVFGRGTAFMVQHLDLKRGELTGEAVRLADYSASSVAGLDGLSIASDGRIAYRSGGGTTRQLKWYDREGKPGGIAGDRDSAALLYPELSPDGRQIAMIRTIQGNTDVWLMDLVRGGMTRFTFDPSIDLAPIWSSDGARIAFASSRKGPYNLYVKPSSSAGAEEVLLENSNVKYTQDWSKDGRFLLYTEVDPKTGRDLWALPMMEKDRKPIAVVQTLFEELNGQFSPDGHWVAYETNESGEYQIVVQPFPAPTGKWQISTGGGTQPRWRADGKELYFIAPDAKLMAASVTAQGATFSPGTPVALFLASPVTGLGANRPEYAVARDGRFLINQAGESSTAAPITLLLNWKPKP